MKSIDNNDIVYIENKISDNAVLLVHGITSSKDEDGFYIELSDLLNDHKLSTLRFDFRGHGESKIPSENYYLWHDCRLRNCFEFYELY